MQRSPHDALTGLYTRTYYLENAGSFLRHVITPDNGAACIFYDIAGMKAYNDQHGYGAGDELLRSVATTLNDIFPNSLVARLESDHFVVLTGEADIIERLDASAEALPQAGEGHPIKVRIGIFPIGNADVDPVMAADNAKRVADSMRTDLSQPYVFFDTAFDWRVHTRLHVVDSIDEAIEEGWIKVFFQPVIRTITGGLCGLEALARWEDPIYGMLSPAHFIPPLEDALLIHKLDSYVVREVCRLYRERTDTSKPTVPVSVNLSRLDFVACDVHNVINEAIAEFDMPREMLNIEITESTFIQNADIMSTAITHFRESGHNVWMDDFGSGYSSLNVLKDYRFDELKLDMAFLSNWSETSRSIVTSTISMAKRIGIHTLAEGVETREQYEFLRSIGCEKAQGYFFGTPLPIDECMRLINVHGLKVETPPWRRYFDAIGSVDFITDDPLVLLEDDLTEFHVLYYNEAGAAILEALGVESLTPDNRNTAFMRSSLAQSIRANLSQALTPGEQATFGFFGNGQHAKVEVQGIARNGLAHAYQVTLTGLTHAQSMENLKLANAVQALISTCHDLQLLDFDKDVMTPVLGIGHSLDKDASHGIAHALRDYAFHHIYPLDLDRFNAFLDLSTLADRLRLSERSTLSESFRSTNETGDYAWRIYTIVPYSESGHTLLLYSRDAQFEETCIELKPKLEAASTNGAIQLQPDDTLAVIKKLYDGVDNPVSLANVETHEIVYLNPYARRMYGISEEKVTAPCYQVLRNERVACASCREQLLSGDCHEELSSFNHKLNRYFNYKDSLLDVDGTILRLEISFDLTREQQAMSELAETDSLTGLLNRRGCDRQMAQRLQEAEGPFALIAIDVNDFKLFNDLHGHAAGDVLLISTANDLKTTFGPTCIVGRNGRDEFLVLVPISSEEDARLSVSNFADRRHGFSYGGNNYRFGLSVGYALYPSQADDFTELCRKADRALYHVKSSPSTWSLYAPQMEYESRTMLGFNLKDIALGMPGAILVYKADGGEEILYANDALVKMFECNNMEDFLQHVGNSFKTLVHPGDIDRVEESIWNQIDNNDDNLDYVDYRIITKTGAVKDIWDTGHLVESPYYGRIFYVFMYDKGKWEEVIRHQ